MHSIHSKWLANLPQHLRGVIEYYPDVLLFELNQIQYTHLWHRLSASKYVYTNGYEIKPTHWFMYAFQAIKGWFGYNNHCDPIKVSSTLNKLAYYGYMNQFAQPDFTLPPPYALSPKIRALVHNQRNDATTAELQSELVNAYFHAEPYFKTPHAYSRLHSNHRFGDSWKTYGGIEFIPQLDPQDDSLIREVLQAIEDRHIVAKSVLFLKESKYARAAAEYYCYKAHNTQVPSLLMWLLWKDPRPSYLAMALEYDPEITKRHTAPFIEYYLGLKEYEKACNLMEMLSDSKLVLQFLLAIPEVDRTSFIKKDTHVAAVLAAYSIEKKQLLFAKKLYTNIEELSPPAAFSLEIQEKNYAQAYDIFKRNEAACTFSMSERIELARIFFDEGESLYIKGKKERVRKQWKEAKHHYQHSLEQKKCAYHLNPSAEYLEDVYAHKRLYALILIDADCDLYKPAESDIASIHKAITLLKEDHSGLITEQEYKKTVLATGLMRRIDTLCDRIAFSYPSFDHSVIKAHKITYQKEIDFLIDTLKELITLLEGTLDKTLRLKLGKAHFLLADAHLFFDIPAPDINQHHKMAMEIVPDNPFYILRASELFPEETEKLRIKGSYHLKKMGYTVFDYLHWYDERWFKKDDMIFNVKDIHQPTLESTKKVEWSFFI